MYDKSLRTRKITVRIDFQHERNAKKLGQKENHRSQFSNFQKRKFKPYESSGCSANKNTNPNKAEMNIRPPANWNAWLALKSPEIGGASSKANAMLRTCHVPEFRRSFSEVSSARICFVRLKMLAKFIYNIISAYNFNKINQFMILLKNLNFMNIISINAISRHFIISIYTPSPTSSFNIILPSENPNIAIRMPEATRPSKISAMAPANIRILE